MNNEQKKSQQKKEQVKLRIWGVILMVIGYGLAFGAMAADSPFGIFAKIIAFVGIIMILRSFLHVKYKNEK